MWVRVSELVQCHGKEMVFKGRKLKSPVFKSK